MQEHNLRFEKKNCNKKSIYMKRSKKYRTIQIYEQTKQSALLQHYLSFSRLATQKASNSPRTVCN